jgi:hypothetical protein
MWKNRLAHIVYGQMEKGAKTDTQKGEMGPKTDQLKDRLTTGRDKDRLQNGKNGP